MKKILISDYFGSLITPEPDEINQLYHTNFDCSNENAKNVQNFAISKLNQELEEFLYNGNELVIVTNLGHCDIDVFIEHWIGKTLKLFIKYINQIKVVLQDERLEENNPLYVNKNNCFYLLKNEYIFQIIKRKNEVFNYLDSKNKLLFSIGDSINDIDMLAKNIQIGGISSIINYSLLCDQSNDQSNDNHILFGYASSKNILRQSLKEYKYYIETGDIYLHSTFDDEYSDLQFQIVSEQYKKGLISLDDIRKKTMIYELFSMYYSNCFTPGPIIDIEKIDQCYNSCLIVNSSFNEFNQKVMKKVY